MINISRVKFSPCFFLYEDKEEERTESDHGDVHWLSQDAEADRPLEVYAERYEDTVSDERTVHPTEAVCKADDNPSHEAEQRTVEYPFRQLELEADRQQQTVNEHHQCACRWYQSYDKTAHLPYSALAEMYKEYALKPFNNILFFHKHLFFQFFCPTIASRVFTCSCDAFSCSCKNVFCCRSTSFSLTSASSFAID